MDGVMFTKWVRIWIAIPTFRRLHSCARLSRYVVTHHSHCGGSRVDGW
jgi:hypothetical protein